MLCLALTHIPVRHYVVRGFFAVTESEEEANVRAYTLCVIISLFSSLPNHMRALMLSSIGNMFYSNGGTSAFLAGT